MSDLRPNIWQLQAQRDSKALIDALQSADSDVRQRAAAALHALGTIEAIPALSRAMNAEQDDIAKAHFKIVLDDLEQERQARAPRMSEQTRSLVAQLQGNNPAAIIKAANQLGKLKDKTAVESLVLIFYNTQLPASVRLSAAEALIELNSAPTVVSLLVALKSDSWQTRRNGAAILGQLRAEWATERIAEHLDDENEHVRRTAHAALKKIGTPEARNALKTTPVRTEQPDSTSAPDKSPSPRNFNRK